MVGLKSITFARGEACKTIYGVRINEVKTGVMGLVGNKGSIVTKIYINDSLIQFANTHLPSGKSTTKRAECVNNLFTAHVKKEKSDFFVIFGDLNLRAQISLEEYKEIMLDYDVHNEKIEWDKLRGLDECAVGMQPILSNHFIEAPLHILPTYRFVRGSTKYSEERVASWTDRIFINMLREDFGVQIEEFNTIKNLQSDHW